jgi:hypothetical protein
MRIGKRSRIGSNEAVDGGKGSLVHRRIPGEFWILAQQKRHTRAHVRCFSGLLSDLVVVVNGKWSKASMISESRGSALEGSVPGCDRMNRSDGR